LAIVWLRVFLWEEQIDNSKDRIFLSCKPWWIWRNVRLSFGCVLEAGESPSFQYTDQRNFCSK